MKQLTVWFVLVTWMSWVSPLVWVITIDTLLITLLVTTHEPSSRVLGRSGGPYEFWRTSVRASF